MTEELEPCPFCGGQAKVYDDQIHDWPPFYWVSCSQCLARGSESEDRQKAIDAWNRRANC